MLTVNTAVASTTEDMSVLDFSEKKYLPYCEEEWKGTGMRASTVRGFKQSLETTSKKSLRPPQSI
jgi:hypothetical protein